MLRAIGVKGLVGETVVEVKNGSKHTPKCGSYGAYTLITKSGRELVVWNSMGEVNISEVIEEDWVRGPEPMLDRG